MIIKIDPSKYIFSMLIMTLLFTLTGCAQEIYMIKTDKPLAPTSPKGNGKIMVGSCINQVESNANNICTDIKNQIEYDLLKKNIYAENEQDNPERVIRLKVLTINRISTLKRTILGQLTDADEMGVIVDVFDHDSGKLVGSAVISYSNNSKLAYSVSMIADRISKRIVEYLGGATGSHVIPRY